MTACEVPSARSAPAKHVRVAANAMGTRFEFVLCGDDEVRLRAAGEAALGEVLALHRRLSAFDRASEISRLNREAGAGWVRTDPETWNLLILCRRMWRETGGAFDVTVGPLMKAWGFRGGAAVEAAIDAARRCTGFDKVDLDEQGGRVRFLAPGVQIDLGGIGKGAALDAAAAVLRDAGVERAFLHGGTSTCVAMGEEEPSWPWRVALSGCEGAPVVELRDCALSVSAPEGRLAAGPSGPAGHVLDPRTGEPSAGARRGAALADSAAVADAWSTAALVLGGSAPAASAGGSAAAGVEVEDGGMTAWSFQGCWPLVERPGLRGRQEVSGEPDRSA